MLIKCDVQTTFKVVCTWHVEFEKSVDKLSTRFSNLKHLTGTTLTWLLTPRSYSRFVISALLKLLLAFHGEHKTKLLKKRSLRSSACDTTLSDILLPPAENRMDTFFIHVCSPATIFTWLVTHRSDLCAEIAEVTTILSTSSPEEERTFDHKCPWGCLHVTLY